MLGLCRHERAYHTMSQNFESRDEQMCVIELKHYTEATEGKPIGEEYYVGYIDDTSFIQKFLQKETLGT